jgi:hypothetical protein
MLGSKKNQFFFYSTPLLVFLLVPLIVRASELQYTPLAPLTDSQAGHAISLTSYLPFMFTLLIGVSALLAMVMIVVGGITYMTTDVFSTKSSGRGMMTSAVYGLLFVLSSYMILYTINPDLLSFKLSFVGLKGAEWGGGVTVPDTPTTPTTEAGCASWGGNWVVTPNTDAMSSVGGPSIGSCVGGTPPIISSTPGSRGTTQCATGNQACSSDALEAQGLTAAQAATMSCIAVTELGGQSVGCSGTGPCGTFQISQANWNQYASSQCGKGTGGEALIRWQNSATCNAQTMVTMVGANGYQPWTGNNNGVAWNTAASACVNNFDPNTTLRR